MTNSFINDDCYKISNFEFADGTKYTRAEFIAASPIIIKPPVEFDLQLINNPSAEEGIDDWNVIVGQWSAITSSHTKAVDGELFFYPMNTPNGELSQLIDVSTYSDEIDNGNQIFDFSGYRGGQDQSKFILEFIAIDNSILSSWDSGEKGFSDAVWQQVNQTEIAPMKTRSINIRLIGRRTRGSSNDAYFDTLQLTAVSPI